MIMKAGEDKYEIGTNRFTSLWKGGEKDLYSLKLGDDLTARIRVSDRYAMRIWSNLTRVKGRIVKRIGENQFEIDATYHHHLPQQEMLLQLLPETVLTDMVTHLSISENKELLTREDVHLDVIGEQLPEGIRATRILIYRPGPKILLPSLSDLEIRENAVTTCYLGYLGWASWYNCPSGAGGCAGQCNTGNAKQTAWPHTQSCGQCTGDCCDCSSGCRNQVLIPCSSNLRYVQDLCGITRYEIKIVDCGPCQNCPGYPEICNNTCCCCSNYTSAIIDLTRPSFAAFRDPVSYPCLSCMVGTYVTC